MTTYQVPEATQSLFTKPPISAITSHVHRANRYTKRNQSPSRHVWRCRPPHARWPPGHSQATLVPTYRLLAPISSCGFSHAPVQTGVQVLPAIQTSIRVYKGPQLSISTARRPARKNTSKQTISTTHKHLSQHLNSIRGFSARRE